MKFRPRTTEIDAVKYDGTNQDEIVEFMGGERQARAEAVKLPGPGRGLVDGLRVRTLDGSMNAPANNWIVYTNVPVNGWVVCTGPGLFHALGPDRFEATYEPVD